MSDKPPHRTRVTLRCLREDLKIDLPPVDVDLGKPRSSPARRGAACRSYGAARTEAHSLYRATARVQSAPRTLTNEITMSRLGSAIWSRLASTSPQRARRSGWLSLLRQPMDASSTSACATCSSAWSWRPLRLNCGSLAPIGHLASSPGLRQHASGCVSLAVDLRRHHPRVGHQPRPPPSSMRALRSCHLAVLRAPAPYAAQSPHGDAPRTRQRHAQQAQSA